MKTEISRFCEASLNILNGLPPALKSAAENMEQGSEKNVLHRPLAVLNDIRARLRSLVEKLENQHAYLLIFGPLKSGKSTLMNAISGAYVSEVTSLPGYPCLVYVQNAPEARFSVTRYNGRESVFATGRVLKDVVADSHLALAQQIRATEETGAVFDPRTHFSEAIRRIDVKIPVQSLAESSTVLVDTPGLYSRMNFGYDVLTREFRDSAACAVFVVKTDNLFLEQVFEEFNQLLGLFSRIFLVINVDSSKRDLAPDGSLHPSAESQHPEQIIEAFKTLSMAGPLRAAYEENRVRIHAVDLLSSASAFLTSNGGAPATVASNGNGTEKRKDGFNEFLRDLTDYLNSSDYTQEFIRDSLRQGHTLCSEVRSTFRGEEIEQLRAAQQQLEKEAQDLEARIASVDALVRVDWTAAFEKVRQENAARTEVGTKDKADEVIKTMRESLDRWYETSESLKSLQDQRLNPILAEAALSQAADARSRLQALVGTPLGAVEPPATAMMDVQTVGLNLSPIAQAALQKLAATEDPERYKMTIAEEAVPVRKSFADWLLFRKLSTVRRRLFGEELWAEITPEAKQKRLPASSREALYGLIERAVQDKFPGLPRAFSASLHASYAADYRERVLAALRQMRQQLVEERGQRQAPLEANNRILKSIQELDDQCGKVAGQLRELAVQENVPPIADEPEPASLAERAPEGGVSESNGTAPMIEAQADTSGATLTDSLAESPALREAEPLRSSVVELEPAGA